MSMTKKNGHRQSFALRWLLLLLFSLGVDTDHIVNSANASSFVEPEEAAFQGRCGHTSPCEQLCYEIHDGMYECDCIEGYELNRNGYSCQAINAINNDTDGSHIKLDEDVLYQKGASFSAKLANAETTKLKPLKSDVNRKRYNELNPITEIYSNSEVETYAYNGINEQRPYNHKVTSNDSYISDGTINFNWDRDSKVTSVVNSITAQNSFTTMRPTTSKAILKNIILPLVKPSSNNKHFLKYNRYLGGDDFYRYQFDATNYEKDKFNLFKLKRSMRTHTYQRKDNANIVPNTNRSEDPNKKNEAQLHISEPTIENHFISVKQNLTESGQGAITVNTISQCNLDCGSDGICSIEATNTRCLCPFGKTGKHCKEELRARVPRFAKRSWMAFPALHGAYKHVQIRMEFRPESFNGIVMLSGERDDLTGDFMALLLNKGFVEFWFDCGSGVGSVRSRETILLNEWNSVILYRHRWDAWLVLNHGIKVQGRSNGLFSRITFREPVFLGGVGNITGISERLPLGEGFSGCIRRFVANEHDYKFTEHPLGDVINGLDIQDCSTDKCVRQPCHHGGKCLHSDQGAVCLCPIGFVGDLCEIPMDLQVPAFNGSSFLRYAPLGDSALIWLEITVVFKPEQSEGIILYSGPETSGDFIALYLKNGFVEFAFDLGSGPALVRSEHFLTLGQWHSVRISRTARLAVLKVDQHKEIMTISTNGFWHLSLRQSLFVGGVNHVNCLPFDLKSKPFFVGCIQKIEINGRALGIVAEALSGSNVDNCPHACVARPCGLLAKCIPQMESYECQCSIHNVKCYAAAEFQTKQLTILNMQWSKYAKHRYRKLLVTTNNNHKHTKMIAKQEDSTANPSNMRGELLKKPSYKVYSQENQDKRREFYQKSNLLYVPKVVTSNYEPKEKLLSFDSNKTNEREPVIEESGNETSRTDSSLFGLNDSLFDESDGTEDFKRKQLVQNMERIMSNTNDDKKSISSRSRSKDEVPTPVKLLITDSNTTPQIDTDWSLLKKFDLSAEHQPQVQNVKKSVGACFAASESYFHYKDVDTMNYLISYQIDLNLRIKTHSPNGIILWTGRLGITHENDDYLSLGIEDGYLHFRYNLGSGDIDIQFNGTKISDGLWHRVRAIRNCQDGYLEIDGRKTSTLRTPGTLRQLNTNTGLYVGGMPDVSHFTHQKYINGIIGCMSEIVLAGKIRLNFDTNKFGTMHNVETGLL